LRCSHGAGGVGVQAGRQLAEEESVVGRPSRSCVSSDGIDVVPEDLLFSDWVQGIHKFHGIGVLINKWHLVGGFTDE
jgi:hypothetical protein